MFRTAELAQLTEFEYLEYEDNLKVYRDLKNSFDTAFEDGLAKGIEKGLTKGIIQTNIKHAKKMLMKQIPINIIAEITGLSVDEIEKTCQEGIE